MSLLDIVLLVVIILLTIDNARMRMRMGSNQQNDKMVRRDVPIALNGSETSYTAIQPPANVTPPAPSPQNQKK